MKPVDPKPLLSVESLTFSVKGRDLLSDVSFKVEAGELVALIGPNGAGKTTLGKIAAGLLGEYSGRILHHGRDQTALSQRERARTVCYVPQAPSATPAFTVREFVRLARYAYDDEVAAGTLSGRDLADAALAEAGVESLADQNLTTLSGGERQLVWIAAALAQAAPLLWLDEPTAFLDPRHQRAVLDLARRLPRERGIAVVMTTHDLNTALHDTPRVIALKRGRIVHDGPSNDLADPVRLFALYEAPFTLVRHPDTGRAVALPGGTV